jgi:hypothetical protein
MNTSNRRVDTKKPPMVKGLEAILHFMAMDSKSMLKQSTHAEFREALKEIQDLYMKHKLAFDEMGDALVNYHRLNVMNNPTVYIARTKDVKTGIEYFTAKTSWPLKNFKKKDIKIYLGKASDFKGDTLSTKAKDLAVVKMRQTLARRMRAGEI